MTTPQPNTRKSLRYVKHGRRMTPGEVAETVRTNLTTEALRKSLKPRMVARRAGE